MHLSTCPVCRAEFGGNSSVCPRCGRRDRVRPILKVVRLFAGTAILVGAHWTYAAPTLRLKLVALAAVAAGLSAIVATFRQGGAATGR